MLLPYRLLLVKIGDEWLMIMIHMIANGVYIYNKLLLICLLIV